MQVSRYTAGEREEWNAFVAKSRNATFLLHRDYLEYHADRFVDHSLVVRDARERIVALLPANRRENTVNSHGGLTYGGLLVGDDARTADVESMFDAIATSLAADGVTELLYKTIPSIYHRAPAEDDRYALYRRKAELIRRDVLSVIDYRAPIAPQERRARSIKKAQRAGLTVSETGDYAPFWDILARNLQDRYGVNPVHSVDEIRLLASRFRSNIRLFTAARDGETLAGAVVFHTGAVAHIQYNAASGEGKELGALDIVLADLVERFRGEARYFDFGISTEKDGHYLNAGLVEYKEGFGARTVVHDFYRLPIGSTA